MLPDSSKLISDKTRTVQNDAKEYLESRGVQVYVDRSLEVKGVDKRVVSYEIEKNIKV